MYVSFSEKIKAIGEKLEHESKQIQESGLTEETDEETKEGAETGNTCDINMDLSEMDTNTEIIVSTCATKERSSSEEELSLEEIRAQEYLSKKASQSEKTSEDANPDSNDLSSPNSSNVERSENLALTGAESSLPSKSAAGEDDGHQATEEEDNCDKCSAGEEESIRSSLGSEEGDTKAVCDSVDQNKSNSEEEHIHSDSPISDFNSFTFWRDPLPEVSLDLDITSDNQNVSLRTPMENECEPINNDHRSLSPASATNQLYSETGVRIHTANINTVSEESVNNIGSTHVLGQNLNEVMDGIVHGRLISFFACLGLECRL